MDVIAGGRALRYTTMVCVSDVDRRCKTTSSRKKSVRRYTATQNDCLRQGEVACKKKILHDHANEKLFN